MNWVLGIAVMIALLFWLRTQTFREWRALLPSSQIVHLLNTVVGLAT